MPRHARLDAPGALHHVIGRVIERQPIVRDDADRAAFVERRSGMPAVTGTRWYTWAALWETQYFMAVPHSCPLV